MTLTRIPLTQISDNPFQPRTRYEEIAELAAKISAMKTQLPDTLGLIHPPNARRVNGTVQLAEGHRRLRAFMTLEETDPDYAEMPVNLVDLSDDDMDDIAWSENRDRKDLTPTEEARALKRTLEARGLTQQALADLRQLGRSTVANKIRLLNLPDDVLAAVDGGQVTERQAMDLLPALEIKSSDLDGAGLGRDLYFTPGASWNVPTPNTLKKRVIELGNLTGEQIRDTVEQIKKKVEQAKLDRYRRQQAEAEAEAEAQPTPPPPPKPAPAPDVRPQTPPPDLPEPPAEDDETPDWLQPDDDGWNGEPADVAVMQATTPPAPQPPEPPAPKPVAEVAPPPPPAPKPAEPPAVNWQVTISIKQQNGPIKGDTPVLISLFKGGEMVESDTCSYGNLPTRVTNLLAQKLPIEIPF